MAVLGASDLAAVYAYFVSSGESVSIVRADLKAAISAIDAWADSNAASLNAAIPQPARGNLTTRQKARLLEAVVRRRFEVI